MGDGYEAALLADAERATGLSELLGAFDDPGLDPDERALLLRQGEFLAGCLWQAADLLIDELFDDVAALREADGPTTPSIDDTTVICDLPPRFRKHFSPLFAQRFLIAAADLTAGLTRGWVSPKCVAQELALRLWLDKVEDVADTYEIQLPSDWRAMVEELLFEDTDHEYLYSPGADGFEDDPTFGPPGMAPMGIEWWFVPFNADRSLPPYAQDEPPLPPQTT